MKLFILKTEKLKYEENDHTRAFFFKKDKDIIMGSLYIKNFFLNYLKVDVNMYKLLKNEHGKPYFKHNEKNIIINFNISHDGTYVVLFYDNNKHVGVDLVNLKRKIDIVLLKNILHQDEKKNSYNDIFFHIWAFKEAYYKYVGSGISLENTNKISYLDKMTIYNNISITEGGILNSYHAYEYNKINFIELIIEDDYLINTVFEKKENINLEIILIHEDSDDIVIENCII